MKPTDMTLTLRTVKLAGLACAALFALAACSGRDGETAEMLSSTAPAATPGVLEGIVTDSNGTPIRGAIVKASASSKAVARYTSADGKYQIAGLAPARYEVTVDAFGSDITRQTVDLAQSTQQVNFTLPAHFALGRLTSAEMKYFIPDDKDTKLVYSACATCHGFETVLRMRGLPAAGFEAYLQVMTGNRIGVNFFTKERSAELAPAIAKVFGPGGYLGPEANLDFSKVKHIPLSDKALKATITEYPIPLSGPLAHSVTVDNTKNASNGTVWLATYDQASNAIARFHPETEKFEIFPIPTSRAQAHTGDVLADGTFITGLARSGAPTKLVSVGPDGKVTSFDWPEKNQGARVAAADPTSSDRVWVVAGNEVWRLNVKTKEFKAYKNPTFEEYPKGSYADLWGETQLFGRNDGYDIAVDSKGIPWVSVFEMGAIFSLDPATGTTKVYHSPELSSARGLTVDAEDNIWFGDYYRPALGKLDRKSGKITMYDTPNPHAAPYGVLVDRQTGYVWYADTTGNNATRFDPKTEEFVEYALPTKNTALRFMGVDRKGHIWYGDFWNAKLGVIDPGE